MYKSYKEWPNQPLTVKQLALLCEEEVKKGNGDKNIFISDDDEGNGFHALFFGFEEDTEQYAESLFQIDNPEDYDKMIILG